MTNKKIILIIFFVLLIIIIILGAVFVLDNDVKKEILNEEDALRENNSQIINEISEGEIVEVSDIDNNDHYIGKLNSPVEFIVYCDFTDIFCGDLNSSIKEMKEKFTDDIVVAYRHFLVGDNNMSVVSVIASECACEQDKFWEMHQALYALNQSNELTKENIQESANEISLDIDQFNNCLNSERYIDKINTQKEEAKNYGVIGAPTIFVNKEILPGAYPSEDFVDSTGRERQGLKSVIEKYLY